jgi:hypothetical protein
MNMYEDSKKSSNPALQLRFQASPGFQTYKNHTQQPVLGIPKDYNNE